MIQFKKYSTCFILVLLFTIVVLNGHAQNKLNIKNGTWLGVIFRPDSIKIQFNFTTALLNGKQVIYIMNGEEKLLVDDIQTSIDSIVFTLPFFNASLKIAKKGTNLLDGFFVKTQNDKSVLLPFAAYWGIKARFPNSSKSKYQVSGSWEVSFKGKNNSINKAVGSFVQKPNGVVTGSFLTPTGDFRFLEGVVSGDTLKLSGFDGGFSTYFEAKLLNDTTLVDGKFYSGSVASSQWIANKNDNAQLPDEYSYSHLRAGETSLNFKFKNTNGEYVSIQDEKYKNKVVIVQILGSWCPNCMDETAFLSAFYNENKHRGVEIIGLAYERFDQFEAAKKALALFQKRFNVQYPFLITGVKPSDPQIVEKTIPQIDRIAAFPSTIFIDKTGQVRKIHTGYDGPGTGKFYEDFIKEFNENVNQLLKEN